MQRTAGCAAQTAVLWGVVRGAVAGSGKVAAQAAAQGAVHGAVQGAAVAKSGKDAAQGAVQSVLRMVLWSFFFQRAAQTFSFGFEFRGRIHPDSEFWSICTQLSKTTRYMQPFRPKGAF